MEIFRVNDQELEEIAHLEIRCVNEQREQNYRISVEGTYDTDYIVWNKQLDSLKIHSLEIVFNNNNSLSPALKKPKHKWNFTLNSVYNQNSLLYSCQDWVNFSSCMQLC